MKTVRQLAGELGVSKTAVMKQIENLGLHSSLRKNGNQFVIDEAQEELIKQAFSPQSKTKQTKTENQPVFDIVSVLQKTIDTLQGQLEVKDQQLLEKDKQITSLSAALENTTKALQAAQALHAGTIQAQLGPGADQSQENDSVIDVGDQEPVSAEKTAPAEPGPAKKEKRHWWQRIGRKE